MAMLSKEKLENGNYRGAARARLAGILVDVGAEGVGRGRQMDCPALLGSGDHARRLWARREGLV
jgi:hypothetical protein